MDNSGRDSHVHFKLVPIPIASSFVYFPRLFAGRGSVPAPVTRGAHLASDFRPRVVEQSAVWRACRRIRGSGGAAANMTIESRRKVARTTELNSSVEGLCRSNREIQTKRRRCGLLFQCGIHLLLCRHVSRCVSCCEHLLDY